MPLQPSRPRSILTSHLAFSFPDSPNSGRPDVFGRLCWSDSGKGRFLSRWSTSPALTRALASRYRYERPNEDGSSLIYSFLPSPHTCLNPSLTSGLCRSQISATWFIASVIQHVQLGDLTDFDLPEDADQAPWASSSAIPIIVDDSTEAVEGTAPILPVAEENQALRYSTGSVRDWLSEYINRCVSCSLYSPKD